MSKADEMAKIQVLDKDILIIKVRENDYISLTNMLKAKDGDFLYQTG